MEEQGRVRIAEAKADILGTTVAELEARTEADRRRLMGRLASLLFIGSGLVGLATLPIDVPGLNVVGSLVVSILAMGIGVSAWFAPWDRWPRAASLVVVPPAFALIAAGNAYGGSDQRAYGVFFVVAFVWIGLAHPQKTSLLMAPLAAVAYVLPIEWMAEGAGAISSVFVTIPACVLVGESLSWSLGRLDRTEQALREQRRVTEALQRLDQMRNDFLSMVSHELRTPITICRGHLEVLGHDADPAEVRDTVELVVDELDRMGRLVEDMTTLVGLDDRERLHLERIELARFVADLAAKATPILDGRLEVEEPSVATRLSADPQRLTQALLNLLSNAVVHGRGEGPVTLRVLREGGSWRFEVADHGGGVPPAWADQVFEPFRSGPRSSGSGLGLAIVRRIAEAHGGTAGLENHPGEGATFWIRLPV
jgi:signal transduction histidine kinase